MMPLRNMVVSAFLLGVFSIVGTGLVAMTHDATAARIAENERQALLEIVHELIPPDRYNNDPIKDMTTVQDRLLLGTAKPVPVYRARHDGQPVAAVIGTIAPNGYGGDIKLLVAVNFDGTLGGVRVLSQHETPGLGDKIEASRSNWIFRFAGLSLNNPKPDHWKVKKDGGVFDQFTGATITPRAVVGAVYNTLRYFQQHRDELFAASAVKEASHG